jgi:hypothetical protein
VKTWPKEYDSAFGLMKQILNFKEEISTKTAETS